MTNRLGPVIQRSDGSARRHGTCWAAARRARCVATGGSRTAGCPVGVAAQRGLALPWGARCTLL